MPQDILITPTSGEPQILFRGSGNNDTAIQLNVLSSYQSASRSGTALVFEGTEGQLFAITDNLSSGVIFAVGDVTGLPLLKIDASGDVTIAEYGRFVGIGSGLPRFQLDVRGTGNFSSGVITNNATVNGNLGVSVASPNAKTHISTATSTNKGLIVQGAAAQSANLQEWQNSAGTILASVDKDGDISGASGTFSFLQLSSAIPRQSGLLFLDNNNLLNTSANLIYSYANLASPKLAFRASGTVTPDIAINILTTASGTTSGVQTLSFEGSAGQLFSITDVLNSGTIFSVNDISGLSLIEVDASGSVKLARFGTDVETYAALELIPSGTTAGQTNELRFYELASNGANYVGFKSPDSLGANRIWTLPSGDGSSAQVLSTNGSGTLNWITPTPSSIQPVASSTNATFYPVFCGGSGAPFVANVDADLNYNPNTNMLTTKSVTSDKYLGSSTSVTEETTTGRILSTSDNGSIIMCTNNSATTITVPTGLPVGFTVSVIQAASGQITFSPSGTTINNRQGHTKTAGQWAIITLIERIDNNFVLAGDTGT